MEWLVEYVVKATCRVLLLALCIAFLLGAGVVILSLWAVMRGLL